MNIEHNHLLYQSKVNNLQLFHTKGLEDVFEQFLYDLLDDIGMICLIPPQIKISHLNAWTGIVGIVTSHISFHYWVSEKYIQLDIYSCNNFDYKKAIEFINKFWKSSEIKAILINRKMEEEFQVIRLS